MAIAAGRRRPGLGIGAIGGNEAVNAAADHVHGQLAQHRADRPDLALEAVALAQQPRDAEIAAVEELREGERHHREARQVVGQVLDRLVGLQQHPDLAAGQHGLALGHEPLQRDDDVAGGDRIVVAHHGEAVLRPAEPSVLKLNELRHRQPP